MRHTNMSHTKHGHSSKGEIFFFIFAITILYFSTYSVCDEKAKNVYPIFYQLKINLKECSSARGFYKYYILKSQL